MVAEFALSAALRKVEESVNGGTLTSTAANEPAQKLSSALRLLRFFVEDADKKPDKENRIRELLASIEDICYTTEDLLESYALKVESRRAGRGIKGSLKDICITYICMFFELRDQKNLALDLTTQNKTIKDVFYTLESYGLKGSMEDETSSSRGEQYQLLGRTRTIKYRVKDDVIGFEEQREYIVKLLLNDEKKQPVIAISGNGGSGKTTLAGLIYNTDEIQLHFGGFAWVTVGETYRTNNSILQDTLMQLDSELSKEIMNFEDITLVQKLSQVLKSKKCLVILDDVWSSEVWESLRFAFAYLVTHSKVLVTTRDENLAIIMTGNAEYVHRMKALTADKSWKLLRTIAFPVSNSEHTVAPSIEEMGKDMVKKCEGLPLALVALGNLLESKSLAEWEIVHANIDSFLKSNQDSKKLNGIMEVLSMSYNDLPLYLRPCLLYLGQFPEDSKVQPEKLYSMWMAEGIIPFGGNDFVEESVMKIGSSHLEALAAASMVDVQDDGVQTLRMFKSCGIHDIMRKFCVKQAKEDNFFEVMDVGESNDSTKPNDNDNPIVSSSSSTRKTRRLAIYLDKYEGGNPLQSLVVESAAEHLRSLLFLNAYHHDQLMLWPEEILDFKEFILLRVLDFEAYRFRTGTLPNGIEKLLHLRYLSLKGCYLNELPSYIAEFLNLQTLDLRVTKACEIIIPDILWRLERLISLYLPIAFEPKGSDKLHFSGMRELQLLKNFDTRVCDAQHLHKLSKIRILNVTTSGSNEDLEAIIKLLEVTSNRRLQSVIDIKRFDCYSKARHEIVAKLFSSKGLHTIRIDGHMGQLPEMINSFGLAKLSLSGSELVEDSILKLATLPDLIVLVLRDSAYVEKVLSCSESSFPKLKRLELSGLHELAMFTIEKGAMPNLTTLTIERCKRLEIPFQSLNFLSSLRVLNIAMMPREFNSGLRKLKEKLNGVEPSFSIKFLDDIYKVQSDAHSL